MLPYLIRQQIKLIFISHKQIKTNFQIDTIKSSKAKATNDLKLKGARNFFIMIKNSIFGLTTKTHLSKKEKSEKSILKISKITFFVLKEGEFLKKKKHYSNVIVSKSYPNCILWSLQTIKALNFFTACLTELISQLIWFMYNY